jgi:hypothetical protein
VQATVYGSYKIHVDHGRQLQVLVLVNYAVDGEVHAPRIETSGAAATFFWIDTRRTGTLQYGTARHGTARHGTARHGTAR